MALNSHPPFASSKKTCTGRQKMPRSKKHPAQYEPIQQWSSPLPLWKQGPQSRCTGPKKQKPVSKTNTLSVQKNSFKSNTNSSKKLSPQGPGNKRASLPAFSCPQVKKKNMARSKKHVQVQNKGAKVQKNPTRFKTLPNCHQGILRLGGPQFLGNTPCSATSYLSCLNPRCCK